MPDETLDRITSALRRVDVVFRRLADELGRVAGGDGATPEANPFRAGASKPEWCAYHPIYRICQHCGQEMRRDERRACAGPWYAANKARMGTDPDQYRTFHAGEPQQSEGKTPDDSGGER